MDLLQSYDAEDVSSPPRLTMIPKSSAPKVDDTMLFLKSNKQAPLDHVVNFNPTYDQLWGPPSHPYAKDGKLGFVENAFIASFTFDQQYNNTFDKYNIPQHEQKRRKLEKKKENNDETERVEVENPASDVWLLKNRKSPWAGKKEGLQGELTEEQNKYAKKKKGEEGASKVVFTDKSTFHGKEERDYQGRSWIAPPNHARRNNDHCYVPNRLVHTWSGHIKGVSAIRFFPRHGHLLLSAGMDKTGQVISTFSTGKMPYVVKLNPDDDKQNILLAGTSDNKIVQWDINTGQITQEYDQHLGAVNTITFVDNNRRFVTSSDDKSLRVWEFGIPVVIKYISEPHMHSMPAVLLHPNGNWLAAQSLDNQVLIYSTRERFQLKKSFSGHVVAGYACQVNFSPDGQFVMSGDGEGRCWFWDWKGCKVPKKLKCHESVCIGAEWLPLEQSKVVTCGWDGLIKYWYESLYLLIGHTYLIYGRRIFEFDILDKYRI
ncbi:pre-mRNA-processing factor 17 isoform X1 [Tanacetum coccineum]